VIAYVLGAHLQPSQTFVHQEIEELRRQGESVRVLAVRRGEVPQDDVLYLGDVRPGRRPLLASHLRAGLRRPIGYVRYLLRARALRSELGRLPSQVRWWVLPLVAEDLRRDRVRHLHSHFAWQGAAAADLLAPLVGVPWSVTLHANDVFSRRRNLARKLADADRLVTVCRYNEDWMRRHLGLTRPVHQVVCGVRVPERPWPRTPGADVVTVGRLVPKKGFDVLLRAMALARQQVPAATLDIVGEGPCRSELEALVLELGLGDRVRLLGERSHAESLARIAAASVFALPCRVADDGDRDSMPVVVKEAMVREVPVVASDVVAVPEMLAGGCGVLVPPDDPEALAAQLVRLLGDVEGARAMGARARLRVLERFTLEGEVAKLRALFPPDQPSHAPERLH
jgi:colanic acid/amylovoran biosynthesis glycosyltransferase